MMKFIRGKSASNPPTPSKRDTQSKRNSVDLHNKPCALAYDPKLNLLAIGNRNGAIKIYGKQGMEMQAAFDTNESQTRIAQLVFVEGTGRLVCLCEDSSLHLWEIRDHPPLPSPPPPPSPAQIESKSNGATFFSTNDSKNQSASIDNAGSSSSKPTGVIRTRRLIRTKVCTFFSRSAAITLAESLSKSRSLDSAISMCSSVGSEPPKSELSLKSKLNSNAATKHQNEAISKTKASTIGNEPKMVDDPVCEKLENEQTNQKVVTASVPDDRQLEDEENASHTSTSVESSNNESFPCTTPCPSLPFALQRRLCSWSNEIVSFTLNANGSYANIVTRLGELFVMDVLRFELLPQQTMMINNKHWHRHVGHLQSIKKSQTPLQQTNVAKEQPVNATSAVEQRLRLLTQPATRFCSSDLNLNSSCNDSVISCSNSSSSSHTFSSVGSDDASVADFECNSPSIDVPDCSLRSSTRSAVLDRLPTNSHTLQSPFKSIGKVKSKLQMIKVYTSILCSEVEYKTLSISNETTSKQLICLLLSKFKMRHRDPNLFYMTMEISIKKSGVAVKNVMVLNDESCPIQLKMCYPHDDTRFCLMSKNGGLVKVYDSCLMTGSLYKSVLLSENTTSLELIQLILHCYNCSEKVTEFQLYEVTKTKSTAMNDSDLPLKRQMQWSDKDNTFFQLRRSKDMITTIVRSSRQAQCAVRQNECSNSVITVHRDYDNYFYI